MYAKLFTSIYQGTLRGNSRGLLVFTNLLAHADQAGIVDMHPRAICEEVGLPYDEVLQAVRELESPDPESRSPEEQGRRIVRLDEHRSWGWRVVNYAKYRALRNEDDRREQNRLAQQRWRNANKPASAERNQNKPASAEGETNKPKQKQKQKQKQMQENTPPTPRKRGEALPDWIKPEDWQAFREHRTRLRKPMTAEAERRNLADLARLREVGHDPAAVIHQSLVRGWVGLFAVKGEQVVASRQAALEARNAEHAREFARRIREQAQNAAATDGQ